MTTLQFDATVCCGYGDGGEITFSVNITDEAHQLIIDEITKALNAPDADWCDESDLIESIFNSKFPEIHQMILNGAQSESDDLAEDDVDCIMINYAHPFQDLIDTYYESLDDSLDESLDE